MIYFAYSLLMYNMRVCANVELAQSRWNGEPFTTQITFLETLTRVMFNVKSDPKLPPWLVVHF